MESPSPAKTDNQLLFEEQYAGPMPYEKWKGAGPAGYLMFALRVILIVLALIICVPFYYTWRILRLPNPWPRWFLRSVSYICGARIRKIGTPIRRDVVLLANHTSWFDIPMLGGVNGTSFVSKEEIAKWPVVGWLCRLNNTIFISRANRMGVADQINQLREALEECWAVTIFPEGTTTDGTMLLPFKAPLLAALNPPPQGLLVQPVYIDLGKNRDRASWIGDETAPQNAFRLMSYFGAFKVDIHYLDPFDPRDYGDRKAIVAEARVRIQAALDASLSASQAAVPGV